MRPIGIAALEDKIVQRAVAEVLEAVCEQDFLDCSYGFRRGRSPHDAVRTVNRAVRGSMTSGRAGELRAAADKWARIGGILGN